jgi:hypothetical protein
LERRGTGTSIKRLIVEKKSWLRFLLRLIKDAFSSPNKGYGTLPRYSYQKRFIDYQYIPGQKVLDVGSGGDPFPFASILADRYLEPTKHRTVEFKANGKPVVICDIAELPFSEKQFNFVFCSHVLEHVDDPIAACIELQRVALGGYIETPALMKDVLFSWPAGIHKWYVVSINNRLVFFEYSKRQWKGIQGSEWRDVIFGPVLHPLQDAFWGNQDIFNTTLEWKGGFGVFVFRLDGSIAILTKDGKKLYEKNP